MEQRYEPDAEQGLIGAALLYPETATDVQVRGADFYSPAHEQLWDMITTEARSGKAPSVVAISQRLIAKEIRGVEPPYLHQCMSLAPARSQATEYGRMITGLAHLRRMADVGAKLIQDAGKAEWDHADEAVDKARAALDKTLSEGSTGVRLRTFADALMTAVDAWDSPKSPAYRTGWSDLDRTLNGGWRAGELTVIGARPAIGKSIVASCAAVAASAYGGAFFSLEMSEQEVINRMTAISAGVDVTRLTAQQLTELDWEKVRRLVTKSQDWPLFVEEKPRISIAQISAYVRSMKRRGPLPLVIIDYLQLVTPADSRESRERQVSRLAEDCKVLAKEHDTHVIALAQVNRGPMARQDRTPQVADLRESGGIEANADNVILLHRDSDVLEGEMQMIVGKNRNGPEETIRLAWRPHFASVNSMAPGPYDYRYGMETA